MLDAQAYLTAESTFWRLQPGVNIVTFSAPGGSAEVAKSKFTGEIVIDRPLEILDPLAGLCQFSRETDEFHGGEVCQAEIIVTFGDGSVLILPTTGYYSLVIEKSLV